MRGQIETRNVGTRIVLVGTIHVDPASISLVRETIQNTRPEAVALELDKERLLALENPEFQRPSISSGLSFLTMALLERFAGQVTGSSPGLEMLEAAKTARLVGARIETIDRPITITALGIRKLPLKEKIRLGLDGIASLFLLPFGASDLSQLTEDIDNQLGIFKSRYPELSRLLLDEREQYMVSKFERILAETTGKIVGVVGFGHLATIAKSLEEIENRPGYSTSFSWTVRPG
jgi:pheromone shutdown protein TraB